MYLYVSNVACAPKTTTVFEKKEKQTGAVVKGEGFFEGFLKCVGTTSAHWTSRGDHFGVVGSPGVHLVTKVWILGDFREKSYLHFEPFWAPLELMFLILGVQELKIRILFEVSVVRSLFEAVCNQIQEHFRHQKHSFRV